MPKWAWPVLCVVALFAAAVLVYFGIRGDWPTGTALEVAGMYVSLAGFALALFEIRRAQSAAIAAKQAVQRTLGAMAGHRLSLTFPQLRAHADALETAMDADDPDAAKASLVGWRRTALEAIPALRRRVGSNHSALTSLVSARLAALNAKDALYTAESTREACAAAHADMEKTTEELSILLDELVSEDEEDHEPT